MKVSVVRFPGSNSDQDCVHAVRTLGHRADYLWHREDRIGDCDAILVPGGFSYGDYLRAGAIARFSPVMDAVREFARGGGPVLGICNGFQILCEAGLLPGALVRNRGLRFVCRWVHLRTENRSTPFTRAVPEGLALHVPVAHGEGCYLAGEDRLERMEAEGQVLWRYCGPKGEADPEANPNGSEGGIAGVCSPEGNVAGLMPHPERACEDILGSDHGRWILESLLGGAAPEP